MAPTVYIAGPMSGYEDFNYQAFFEAEHILEQLNEEHGFNRKIINPARNFHGDTTRPWKDYITLAQQQVAESDVLVLLAGWEDSQGAQIERRTAVKLGIPVYEFMDYTGYPSPIGVKTDDPAFVPAEHGELEALASPITEEAYNLVMGPRQSDYNHPSDDFTATGRQWGAILTNWLHSEGYQLWEKTATGPRPVEPNNVPDVPPHMVALMMTQLKLSRESHKPKHDNRVDAIGYVLCADRIVEGY